MMNTKVSGQLNVAAVQMMPAEGDPAANVARADRLVRQAVLEHGAGLVVLPECALSGYAMPEWEPDAAEAVLAECMPRPPAPAKGSSKKRFTLTETREMAEAVPGPSVNHLADLASELQTYIVWTLCERRGDNYYNSAVLLSPRGEVLGTYSKVHINKYERQAGWTNGGRFFVWPCEVEDATF